MKINRLKFEYRKSASKLHKEVGECLRNSPLFQNYKIYQEYPVNLINTKYPESSHHFDWVILDLFIVIEVHGKQHYEATDFSGKAEDAGISEYHALKVRDQQKKLAAIEAGWTYIEIPYTDKGKITDSYIIDLYNSNKNTMEVVKDEPILPIKPIQKLSPVRELQQKTKHESDLAKHRTYRSEAYRRAKDRKQRNTRT